jgi:alkanesulfonate monooxygenase SsuD/methylene tetrahydromethanopterin reductase-like flavin-dependent oxidoreductase (luciferase family)
MRTGVVILPDAPWPELRARWQSAQERGFSTGWTYDHLSWRSLREEPWLGTIPLLGALASATHSIRLGTLVTSPNFRHPALLAKDAMTLDQISHGRLDLGIGAGGQGFDADVMGAQPLPPRQRADRFAEFANALDVLLREESTTFRGDFFTAVESRTKPGCLQRPRVPFTVAAAGPRAMQVAAQVGQTWVTYGPLDADAATTPNGWFTGLAQQVARIDAMCEAIGRDPASLARMALVGLELHWAQDSIAAWDDVVGRLGALGFSDVAVHWPRPNDPTLPGPPEAVFDAISDRLAAKLSSRAPVAG